MFFFFCRVHGRLSTSSDPERPDTDEDSQLSYSNTSSPNHMQTSSHGNYVSANSNLIMIIPNSLEFLGIGQ